MKQNYDNKVDMWGLGCIIYELCTNRKAFDSNNVESLKEKIINGKPPKITNTSRKVKPNPMVADTPARSKIKVEISFNTTDDDLQNIYLWCVQKSPDSRPTAADILSLP